MSSSLIEVLVTAFLCQSLYELEHFEDYREHSSIASAEIGLNRTAWHMHWSGVMIYSLFTESLSKVAIEDV